jgi:hypothetical protein
VSADQVFEGDTSIKSDGASIFNNDIAIPTGGDTMRVLGRFYDPGGTTSNRVQRLQLRPGVGGQFPIYIGVQISVSPTHYVTRIDSDIGVENQASIVPISVGWHSFGWYWSRPLIGSSEVRLYIDGALVRTFTGSHPTAPGNLGLRQRGLSGTNDQGYWDTIDMSQEDTLGGIDPAFAGLVESTGSVVLPLFRPPLPGVKAFVGFVQDGVGTITFRHSKNVGATWGISQPLTNAALQALVTAANGDDVLEFTVAQAAADAATAMGADNMDSPALRQLDITYELAPWIYGSPYVAFRDVGRSREYWTGTAFSRKIGQARKWGKESVAVAEAPGGTTVRTLQGARGTSRFV